MARDTANLDITWLRDESLEDMDNLPAPEVIAREIVEDLTAALEFEAVASALEAAKERERPVPYLVPSRTWCAGRHELEQRGLTSDTCRVHPGAQAPGALSQGARSGLLTVDLRSNICDPGLAGSPGPTVPGWRRQPHRLPIQPRPVNQPGRHRN